MARHLRTIVALSLQLLLAQTFLSCDSEPSFCRTVCESDEICKAIDEKLGYCATDGVCKLPAASLTLNAGVGIPQLSLHSRQWSWPLWFSVRRAGQV